MEVELQTAIAQVSLSSLKSIKAGISTLEEYLSKEDIDNLLVLYSSMKDERAYYRTLQLQGENTKNIKRIAAPLFEEALSKAASKAATRLVILGKM